MAGPNGAGTETIRFTTAAGDFAALARGAAGAPVAICLHGFPDIPRGFEPMLRALAAAGWRAVAPWMRGYSPSTLDGPFDVDRLAEDARDFADALSPGRPVAIVGHDWGAVATYGAIARFPERFRRAVTMAVPHPLAIRPSFAQARRSWYMGFFQLPGAIAAVRARDFALIEKLWRDWSPGLARNDAYLRELKACLGASLPAPVLYYQALTRPAGEAWRRLRDGRATPITPVPTLHLQGEDDGCMAWDIAPRQDKFFAGRFESRIIKGVGHFMHIEAPDDIAARVVGWLGNA